MVTSSRSRWSALKSSHSVARAAGDFAIGGLSEFNPSIPRLIYSAVVPVDIAAEVIANTPRSADYNVLALAGPEIAALTAPGQFVMIKARPGVDPLLRRPFSVFELFRDPSGRH